ncbi:MAG: glycosyltransferase family 4 protein [Bacteroidota bacterium]
MKPLNIAIIADPEIPVPPLLYGGIERIIDMLVEGYVTQGHKVSLFAHSDSITKATLFPYKGKSSRRVFDIIKNTFLINKEIYKGNFDVVHSFGRLLYLLPQLPFRLPKIMSYQREPTISQIKKAISLAKKNTLAFTGCSGYISDQIAPFAPAYPIFNGVDLSIYNFKEEVDTDAPLVFLGRIEPIKGTHIAIEVAKKTNKNLIIAGNIPNEYQNYFDTQIKPELNKQITYIGAVNDKQKNALLGNAAAFLMPIEWNEPFGIVMAEAMACGTPVIGFNRGSVPEVVINDYNGYRCNTTDQMVNHVKEINKIDRKNVRKDAEERFSSQVIIKQYLNLYQKIINNQ